MDIGQDVSVNSETEEMFNPPTSPLPPPQTQVDFDSSPTSSSLTHRAACQRFGAPDRSVGPVLDL